MGMYVKLMVHPFFGFMSLFINFREMASFMMIFLRVFNNFYDQFLLFLLWVTL